MMFIFIIDVIQNEIYEKLQFQYDLSWRHQEV